MRSVYILYTTRGYIPSDAAGGIQNLVYILWYTGTMEQKHEGSLENLYKVWHEATEEEKSLGAAYYFLQRRRIYCIGHRYGYDQETYTNRLVAAFAVLSPNLSESQNYTTLEWVLSEHSDRWCSPAIRPSGYHRNIRKAIKVLGVSDNDCARLVTGPKVSAFYANTIDPVESLDVVVDGHMLSCWIGRRLKLASGEANMSKSTYDMVASDIRLVAQRMGVASSTAQATLWLTWRRINRILTKDQTKFDYDLLGLMEVR